ncbi:hypothetical protein [Halalkalicoccus ordinarius]|uniref:hypothetical protein n=1 Tax=Halalkalicoccus ordinarius TaxID=3116651 RepID=UPI00300F729D
MYRRTPWLRTLEGLLFLVPLVLGVGIAGVLQRHPDPRVGRTMVLLASAGGLLVRVGVPICLFLDAGTIRGGDGGWRPDRTPYVLVGLAFSAQIAGVVYLYRRHRRVPVEESEGRWWLVVTASFAGMLVGIPIALVSLSFALPAPVAALPALVGVVAIGLLPPAIYRDAVHVRSHRPGGRWRPNPGLYLGLALAGVTLPILSPFVAGYYLYRRQLRPSRSRFRRVTDKRVAGAGAAAKTIPGVFGGAMAQFSDDDEGKTVVNADGEEVGIIAAVEHGTAHVDPDPGVTDKIMSTLGWSDRDEDTYPLQEESVEAITDDEVRLASTAGTGTDTGTTGAGGAGSGAGSANVGDDSGLTDDDDGIIGDDNDDTIGSNDDSTIGSDDDTIGSDDDGIIGDDDDSTIGSDDDDGIIGDDDDTIGSDNDDDLIGDDDDTIGDDDSVIGDDDTVGDDEPVIGDDDEDDRNTGL